MKKILFFLSLSLIGFHTCMHSMQNNEKQNCSQKRTGAPFKRRNRSYAFINTAHQTPNRENQIKAAIVERYELFNNISLAQ